MEDVRRAPQGVRGLKLPICGAVPLGDRRAPQGVRGLKFTDWLGIHSPGLVVPRKGYVD